MDIFSIQTGYQDMKAGLRAGHWGIRGASHLS